MALIKCPKCGKEYSEHAEKCPECGLKQVEIDKYIEEKRLTEVAERERQRKVVEEKAAEDARICKENRQNWWKEHDKTDWKIFGVFLIIVIIIAISKFVSTSKIAQITDTDAIDSVETIFLPNNDEVYATADDATTVQNVQSVVVPVVATPVTEPAEKQAMIEQNTNAPIDTLSENIVYSIDVLDMDNITKFNRIKWNRTYRCAKHDMWFSEKSGLVTDGQWWGNGVKNYNGYFAFHRFNMTQYTCNFVRTTESMGGDNFGSTIRLGYAVRDKERSSLPIDGDYYVLDLRDWEGYVPLYLPFSKQYIMDVWERGALIFEWVQ